MKGIYSSWCSWNMSDLDFDFQFFDFRIFELEILNWWVENLRKIAEQCNVGMCNLQNLDVVL